MRIRELREKAREDLKGNLFKLALPIFGLSVLVMLIQSVQEWLIEAIEKNPTNLAWGIPVGLVICIVYFVLVILINFGLIVRTMKLARKEEVNFLNDTFGDNMKLAFSAIWGTIKKTAGWFIGGLALMSMPLLLSLVAANAAELSEPEVVNYEISPNDELIIDNVVIDPDDVSAEELPEIVSNVLGSDLLENIDLSVLDEQDEEDINDLLSSILNELPNELNEEDDDDFPVITGNKIIDEIVCLTFFALGMVVFAKGVLNTLRYTLINYLKYDYPDKDTNELLNKSREMMHGNKAQYLVIPYTLIGWFILLIVAIAALGGLFGLVFGASSIVSEIAVVELPVWAEMLLTVIISFLASLLTAYMQMIIYEFYQSQNPAQLFDEGYVKPETNAKKYIWILVSIFIAEIVLYMIIAVIFAFITMSLIMSNGVLPVENIINTLN